MAVDFNKDVAMMQLMQRLSSRVRKRRYDVSPATILDRQFLANRYLAGKGIEIGALHHPLPVPDCAQVRYVDRFPVEDLRSHYPELAALSLTPLDMIDDGETLTKVPDSSQDFVIANHFLEHCEDPIKTLATFFRVLRRGGVLYLAVPEKHHTFDRDRPVTTLAHLWADHRMGPARSRHEHYQEWVRLVDKKTDPVEVEQAVSCLEAKRYSIHFHVWDQPAWLEFILAMQLHYQYQFEVMCQHGIEMINVLRKG